MAAHCEGDLDSRQDRKLDMTLGLPLPEPQEPRFHAASRPRYLQLASPSSPSAREAALTLKASGGERGVWWSVPPPPQALET